MGWVRSEHPGSIGFGVKHIDIHVAFRRIYNPPTNNEETWDPPNGLQPENHHRLKRAKREKGVSSREVECRLYPVSAKKGQHLY